MSRFNVCLLKPPGNDHVEALAELGELIALGLTDLGHAAAFVRNGIDAAARNIILGCHLADPAWARELPPGTIAVNSEQLAGIPPAMLTAVIGWGRAVELWDYSERNIALLASRHGVTARHLRLGYHPALHRIGRAADQDLDVYFYGSINERRRRLLAAVQDAGLRLAHSFGTYGAARDAVIARAKLILNIHHYDDQIFEVVRVSYLMNNAKAVVAEVNPGTAVDAAYLPGLCGVPAEAVVDACRRLVGDAAARGALEEAALATLASMPQGRLLAPLLD